MTELKRIHYNSPEAATYRTDIKGWVSANGMYCGDHEGSEHIARFDGATHRDCRDCGAETHIRYLRCNACRDARYDARYAALDAVEWDGATPVAIFESDTYFFGGESEVRDYCEENQIDPSELQLVHCDPVMGPEFGIDYFEDCLPEEGELPKSIWDAVDNLNRVIKAHGPLGWQPGYKRVVWPAEAQP